MTWLLIILLMNLGGYVPGKGLPPPSAGSPPGQIRIWGPPQLADVASAWEAGFEEANPDLDVLLHFTGSDTAMAGLYTAKADIALIGRDATDAEQKAFEWVFRYRARQIPVLNGSVNSEGQSSAIAILVHPDNPIQEITASQLSRVLLTESAELSWSDIGISGEIAGQPVQVFMPQAESGTGRFLRARLVSGEIRLQWERITEFEDSAAQGAEDNAATRAAEAVVRNPGGLAFGIAGVPGTKTVAVRNQMDTAKVPELNSIQSGEYFLSRQVYAYVNAPDGSGVDENVQRFLEFVLSESGQKSAGQVSDLIPLSVDDLTSSRALVLRN